MGHQIVKQPDGKLAVWSSVVDDFLWVDATKEELVEWYAEEAAKDARQAATKTIDAVLEDRAREVYYQFTKTYEELAEMAQWMEDEDDDGEDDDVPTAG